MTIMITETSFKRMSIIKKILAIGQNQISQRIIIPKAS